MTSPADLRAGVRFDAQASPESRRQSLVLAMRRPRPSFVRRLLARLVALAALLIALPAIPVALHAVVDPPGSAFMRYAHVELNGKGTVRPVRRRWADLTEISRPMRLAVIAAEDQKFPAHYGFDLDALAKAYERNQRSKRIRGGSTISQQVAKNLYLWPGRSYLRKGLEAWLTLLIETFWSKRRILEVYLNVAQFDSDLFGVEAAAQRFFGKPAARLNREEAALLAAVLPNPRRFKVARPTPYLLYRQQVILRHMRALGMEHLGAL
jgi:monofunctional biosynthetic peptidoglycan transglycosylase